MLLSFLSPYSDSCQVVLPEYECEVGDPCDVEGYHCHTWLKWSKVRAVVRLFLLSDIPAHSPLIGLHRL